MSVDDQRGWPSRPEISGPISVGWVGMIEGGRPSDFIEGVDVDVDRELPELSLSRIMEWEI